MNNLTKVFKYENENGDSIIFTPDNGYLINKPSGIDTVSVKLSTEQAINQVGATVQSINIRPRPVTVSGQIYGDLKSRKDKLLSVIRPDLSGKLFADGYYLKVYPTSTPVIGYEGYFAKFQFSVTAPYPYWQKDAEATTVLAGMHYKFKFPWNISKTWKFAETMETQFINVTNKGELPVPFSATFKATGEVTNPRITNVVTGKYMLLNYEMERNESIIVKIDHDKTTVTSSINGDIRGALNLLSSLRRLAIGDNLLKPDAEAGGSGLEVSINFAEEIVGITL